MQEPKPSFPLLSLPDLPLMIVAECLQRWDKLCLASSCRRLATVVCAASKKARLTVTRKTRWTALLKLLATNTMTCRSLTIDCRMATSKETSIEDSAPQVLLDSIDIPPGCSLTTITEVTIYNGLPVPCLLPPNIARMLPKLETLYVWSYQPLHDGLQPIPYCSSLRKLVYYECFEKPQQLPIRSHSAEDLRRQLPNITSLELCCTQRCAGLCGFFDTMIDAWGGSLVHLELDDKLSPAKLQHCTQLQSLICFERPQPSLFGFLPWSLTKLRLWEAMQEKHLHAILQLPVLQSLDLGGFETNLQQDWSNHQCAWQKVTMDKLYMLDVSNLPLRSLKGDRCLIVPTLVLPNPLLPNSLADVTYAAQCVGNADIIVEGSAWECDSWNHVPTTSGIDAASAELIRIAGSDVQPSQYFLPGVYALSQYPQSTKALTKWASKSVQKIFFKHPVDALPWFWQALQCCNQLEKVSLICDKDVSRNIHDTSLLVQLAAEHLVAVTGRSIELDVRYATAAGNPNQEATRKLQQELQQRLLRCINIHRCSLQQGTMNIKLTRTT